MRPLSRDQRLSPRKSRGHLRAPGIPLGPAATARGQAPGRIRGRMTLSLQLFHKPLQSPFLLERGACWADPLRPLWELAYPVNEAFPSQCVSPVHLGQRLSKHFSAFCQSFPSQSTPHKQRLKCYQLVLKARPWLGKPRRAGEALRLGIYNLVIET